MAMIPEGEMNGDGSSVEPSMAGRFTKFFCPAYTKNINGCAVWIHPNTKQSSSNPILVQSIGFNILYILCHMIQIPITIQ